MNRPPHQAIILAAGEGQRLRPLTSVLPKPLVPFFGRPLIDWSVRSAIQAGVRRIAINAYHLADVLAKHVELLALRHPAVQFHLSREPALLGTGGALRFLATQGWFEPGPFWVLNSDAVFEASLFAMASSHAPLALMTNIAGEHRHLRRLLVHQATLIGLDESAPECGQAFCGVTLGDTDLISALPPLGPSCILRDGILRLLPTRSIGIYATDGFFADTGTPALLADAHIRGQAFAASLPAGFI